MPRRLPLAIEAIRRVAGRQFSDVAPSAVPGAKRRHRHRKRAEACGAPAPSAISHKGSACSSSSDALTGSESETASQDPEFALSAHHRRVLKRTGTAAVQQEDAPPAAAAAGGGVVAPDGTAVRKHGRGAGRAGASTPNRVIEWSSGSDRD